MSIEQMAVQVSAGIPTNQGNQYLECLNSDIYIYKAVILVVSAGIYYIGQVN